MDSDIKTIIVSQSSHDRVASMHRAQLILVIVPMAVIFWINSAGVLIRGHCLIGIKN